MPRALPPRRPALLLAASALALPLALAACTTAPMPAPSPTPSETVAASGDGVLRVGTLFSMTGPRASLGAAQVAGVNAAIREINAAGGVLGAPVEIVNRDAGDPSGETAEAAFAAFVEKGVDVVIGPDSSELVERLLPLAADAGIPLVSPAVTDPAAGRTAAGFFARTVPAYPLQAAVLAELLSEDGAQQVALIVGSDELSASIAEPLAEALGEHDAELVATETVASASTAASAASAVSRHKPDAVVVATPDAGDVTTAVLAGLADAGYGGEKLWLTSQNVADYSQALPAGALQGANGIRASSRPDDAFIAKLKVEDPGLGEVSYAAEAYDATVIAALAAVLAGDDGGPSIASRLAAATRDGIPCTSFGACVDVLTTEPDVAYEGILGPLRLDDAGAPTVARYEVYRYDAENRAARTASAGGVNRGGGLGMSATPNR